MASLVLESTDFKAYQESVGPGRGHPARPSACRVCDWPRVWFDGWRFVFCVILSDGSPHRFDNGLPLKRVVCARCGCSWPLRPSFLYPHRSLEPDLAEASALAYLSDPGASYSSVSRSFRLFSTLGLALGRLAFSSALRSAVARLD